MLTGRRATVCFRFSRFLFSSFPDFLISPFSGGCVLLLRQPARKAGVVFPLPSFAGSLWFFLCLPDFPGSPDGLFYGAVGFGNDFLGFCLRFADDVFPEFGGFVQLGAVFFHHFIEPFFIFMDFPAFFFPIAFIAGNVFQVTGVIDMVFSDL